jgi:hypothetical protein
MPSTADNYNVSTSYTTMNLDYMSDADDNEDNARSPRSPSVVNDTS